MHHYLSISELTRNGNQSSNQGTKLNFSSGLTGAPSETQASFGGFHTESRTQPEGGKKLSLRSHARGPESLPIEPSHSGQAVFPPPEKITLRKIDLPGETFLYDRQNRDERNLESDRGRDERGLNNSHQNYSEYRGYGSVEPRIESRPALKIEEFKERIFRTSVLNGSRGNLGSGLQDNFNTNKLIFNPYSKSLNQTPSRETIDTHIKKSKETSTILPKKVIGMKKFLAETQNCSDLNPPREYSGRRLNFRDVSPEPSCRLYSSYQPYSSSRGPKLPVDNSVEGKLQMVGEIASQTVGAGLTTSTGPLLVVDPIQGVLPSSTLGAYNRSRIRHSINSGKIDKYDYNIGSPPVADPSPLPASISPDLFPSAQASARDTDSPRGEEIEGDLRACIQELKRERGQLIKQREDTESYYKGLVQRISQNRDSYSTDVLGASGAYGERPNPREEAVKKRVSKANSSILNAFRAFNPSMPSNAPKTKVEKETQTEATTNIVKVKSEEENNEVNKLKAKVAQLEKDLAKSNDDYHRLSIKYRRLKTELNFEGQAVFSLQEIPEKSLLETTSAREMLEDSEKKRLMKISNSTVPRVPEYFLNHPRTVSSSNSKQDQEVVIIGDKEAELSSQGKPSDNRSPQSRSNVSIDLKNDEVKKNKFALLNSKTKGTVVARNRQNIPSCDTSLKESLLLDSMAHALQPLGTEDDVVSVEMQRISHK